MLCRRVRLNVFAAPAPMQPLPRQCPWQKTSCLADEDAIAAISLHIHILSSISLCNPRTEMRFILPLLCVAALSITVRGQASPVENKKASPAQQFIDAAQRIAGDGQFANCSFTTQLVFTFLYRFCQSPEGRSAVPQPPHRLRERPRGYPRLQPRILLLRIVQRRMVGDHQ